MKLDTKAFSDRNAKALTEEDAIFLQQLIHEIESIISQIRSIKREGNTYDRYAILYLQNFLTLSFLVRTYQSLWGIHSYCMQYMREYHPAKIRTLETLLSSQWIWSARLIPPETMMLLLPRLSTDVAYGVQTILKISMSTTSLFQFDARFFANFFEEKILPYKISLFRTIGLFLARIKVRRSGVGLISSELGQIFQSQLEPGDIILTRSNWYLTNASIPGFWKHMSIYMGDGRICEAVGEGIQLSSLTDMLALNDYALALRTRFTSQKIQAALQYVTQKIGHPYDFSFNFFCEKSLVCSALVTKAYLPHDEKAEWLDLDLELHAGSYTFPPNSLVKKACKELGTDDEQLFPVAFIDAHERKGFAFWAPLHIALKTWKRSRWSFWQR
jgi:hypothetical protein